MIPRLRAIAVLAFWVTGIALVAPVMIALTLVTGNENFIYKPIRWFVNIGFLIAGVRLAVTGVDRLDPRASYVFTPNHQSFIEVPLLVIALERNVAFLAKKELFRYPVFGFGMRVIGIVPIDRSDNQSAIQGARLATKKLREGKSYVVYPEGTRSPDGRLLPFKKGAFVMAIEAGVPVVPVTISGSVRAMPKGQLEIHPSVVQVTVHEPIPTTGYTKDSVTGLVELARSRILSALPDEGN
jgi:1-acyl-sn-glycerol-3-phosphate acyltransferase